MAEAFLMRWPELSKEVRVEPIERNREVFDWFVGNLPLRALQGHAVVSGFGLFSQNVGFKKRYQWREAELELENLSKMAEGRLAWVRTIGKAGNLIVKWGEMSEPLDYASWATVVEEDLETLAEVGQKMWSTCLAIEKPIIHVEFRELES
jgi:hypothetical protein